MHNIVPSKFLKSKVLPAKNRTMCHILWMQKDEGYQYT